MKDLLPIGDFSVLEGKGTKPDSTPRCSARQKKKGKPDQDAEADSLDEKHHGPAGRSVCEPSPALFHPYNAQADGA